MNFNLQKFNRSTAVLQTSTLSTKNALHYVPLCTSFFTLWIKSKNSHVTCDEKFMPCIHHSNLTSLAGSSSVTALSSQVTYQYFSF